MLLAHGLLNAACQTLITLLDLHHELVKLVLLLPLDDPMKRVKHLQSLPRLSQLALKVLHFRHQRIILRAAHDSDGTLLCAFSSASCRRRGSWASLAPLRSPQPLQLCFVLGHFCLQLLHRSLRRHLGNDPLHDELRLSLRIGNFRDAVVPVLHDRAVGRVYQLRGLAARSHKAESVLHAEDDAISVRQLPWLDECCTVHKGLGLALGLNRDSVVGNSESRMTRCNRVTRELQSQTGSGLLVDDWQILLQDHHKRSPGVGNQIDQVA
mmetsp:Transcript_70221/g.121629  ORF Transcript_70221/g.121629 Transcript_70221/m.121629 type:complete len:267 (-) Transcript_70221:1723-2523(-)